MNNRKFITIHRSFYDAVSDLDAEDRMTMICAFCDYAFDGIEPEISGDQLAMWKVIRPFIDDMQPVECSPIDDQEISF